MPHRQAAESAQFKATHRKLVIIESPFAGDSAISIASNLRYARMCIRDSISRGESPIASHLLYTQDGILLDTIPEERQLGIACGYAWMRKADLIVFYTDLGWSTGMKMAKHVARCNQYPTEARTLPASLFPLNPAPPMA